MKDLIKRIIDTTTYNTMQIDTSDVIESACSLADTLASNNVTYINEDIIIPLMDLYKDSEDTQEQSFIRDTITMVMEYVAKMEG